MAERSHWLPTNAKHDAGEISTGTFRTGFARRCEIFRQARFTLDVSYQQAHTHTHKEKCTSARYPNFSAEQTQSESFRPCRGTCVTRPIAAWRCGDRSAMLGPRLTIFDMHPTPPNHHVPSKAACEIFRHLFIHDYSGPRFVCREMHTCVLS